MNGECETRFRFRNALLMSRYIYIPMNGNCKTRFRHFKGNLGNTKSPINGSAKLNFVTRFRFRNALLMSKYIFRKRKLHNKISPF